MAYYYMHVILPDFCFAFSSNLPLVNFSTNWVFVVKAVCVWRSLQFFLPDVCCTLRYVYWRSVRNFKTKILHWSLGVTLNVSFFVPVIHYFLSPLLVAHGFIPVLLSNLLLMVAASYYHYLNFLGYDGKLNISLSSQFIGLMKYVVSCCACLTIPVIL